MEPLAIEEALRIFRNHFQGKFVIEGDSANAIKPVQRGKRPPLKFPSLSLRE